MSEVLRTSSIEFVLTRHEQAAAFMAATHGRLTGRPGVCISTLGPGALNFSTGAAYAHLGAMPMIMITGQKAIMTASQARFQIVDVIASMKPLTKMTRQIVSAAASRPSCARRSASRWKSGPDRCFWNCPRMSPPRRSDDVPIIPPHPLDRPVAHPTALDRAAEMILAAKTAAHHDRRRRQPPALVDALSAFVRRTRLPFFNTQMGKGAVTGGSNLYMGTAALSERDYVHEAIDQADLIISSATTQSKSRPSSWGRRGPKVIHIGYTSGQCRAGLFSRRRGDRRYRRRA